jgi:signal peptidase I
MLEPVPQTPMTQRDFLKELIDFLKDLIVIIAIVLFIRTFFIMPFQINGQSMYDSYYDGEFIIVDRFSYRDFPLLGQYQDVERGDVIVFKPRVSDDRKYFIKRII